MLRKDIPWPGIFRTSSPSSTTLGRLDVNGGGAPSRTPTSEVGCGPHRRESDPVPSECESLARSIRSLVDERGAIRASLAALPPRERWSNLGTVGDLDEQIEAERRRFETCLRQHRAAYRASLRIFDTSTDLAPSRPRVARLWRQHDEGPELLEEVPVGSDALTFTRHRDAGAPVGVTIEETGDPTIKGPDLRSGWLVELPGTAPYDPDGRIEIVCGRPRSRRIGGGLGSRPIAYRRPCRPRWETPWSRSPASAWTSAPVPWTSAPMGTRSCPRLLGHSPARSPWGHGFNC